MQKCAQFVLEGDLTMMFFLSGDVVFDCFHLGKADGEYAVAILPCESVKLRTALFEL